MRLVMTLLVRDEEEILEDNLGYHLNRGVDFVVAIDDGSRDATPEILHGYEREGVLRVLPKAADEFDQAAMLTRMAVCAAADHGADWVFHVDADEFWWPQAGSVKDVLAGVPEELGIVEVPRRNFVAVPEGDGPFHQWMTVREVESRNARGLPLEPKVAHRSAAESELDHGGHRVDMAGARMAPRLPLIEVFHFPVRTYAQFERKVTKMGHAFERSPGVAAEFGRDQRELYRVQREGGLPDHFQGLLMPAERVAAGVASGALIEDRRLADFIAAAPRPPAPPAPDPAARLFAHWVTARVDHLEREEERLRARVLELGDEQSRLHEHAREVGDAYGEALDQLEAVRSSRVMRYTAPARRLLYRLRGERDG